MSVIQDSCLVAGKPHYHIGVTPSGEDPARSKQQCFLPMAPGAVHLFQTRVIQMAPLHRVLNNRTSLQMGRRLLLQEGHVKVLLRVGLPSGAQVPIPPLTRMTTSRCPLPSLVELCISLQKPVKIKMQPCMCPMTMGAWPLRGSSICSHPSWLGKQL